MSKLMEHYARENERAEQERVAKVRQGGKIATVYDDTTGGRFPSWMPLIGSSKKTVSNDKE